MNFIPLGTIGLKEGKELVEELVSNNIDARLDHNNKTCSRGCTITVELSVAEHSIEDFTNFMKAREEKLNSISDNEIINLDADTIKCFGCSIEFKSSLKECPNCGLNYDY